MLFNAHLISRYIVKSRCQTGEVSRCKNCNIAQPQWRHSRFLIINSAIFISKCIYSKDLFLPHIFKKTILVYNQSVIISIFAIFFWKNVMTYNYQVHVESQGSYFYLSQGNDNFKTDIFQGYHFVDLKYNCLSIYSNVFNCSLKLSKLAINYLTVYILR